MSARYNDNWGDDDDQVYEPRGFDAVLGDFEAKPCYYCGMPANTVDHVVPQSLLDSLRILDDTEMVKILNNRHRVKTVDACRECNSLIGARYFVTLSERKLWLKNMLRMRYKKVLQTPAWRESELAELSPGLRGYVMQGIHDAALLRKRIAF